MNATEACIALNMLPTVGPVRLRKLLEVFKEPQQILAAKRTELRKVEGIGNEVADQISNWESTVDLAGELERVRAFGATVMTQESPSYPRSLREIHAPPIVLYVWGETVLRGTDYNQRTCARDRHCSSSRGARGKRTHDRRDRIWFGQTLSARKCCAGRENPERKWRNRVRVFNGNRTRSTNFSDA